MKTIVNLTPHPLAIYTNADVLNLPRCSRPCRVEQRNIPGGIIPLDDGEEAAAYIAVFRSEYGAVENLPEPQPGTVFVVSGMVLAALGTSRPDVMAPGDQVRDEAGNIVGCRGLRSA